MTDVVFLKMPNHNIDYPHLATPILTRVLRQNGVIVKQMDINLLLRDYLLTEKYLEQIYECLIPDIAIKHMLSPHQYERARTVLVYLKEIKHNIGFNAIENIKEKMQKREYLQIFQNKSDTKAVSYLFALTGLLHTVIDLAISNAELYGKIDNPVMKFLSNMADEIVALHPRIIGFSVLQIHRRATLWFAHHLKSITDVIIILGGPDVTMFPKVYLEASDSIDYVFLKEAETSLLRFVQGISPEKIDGIGYRDRNRNIKINKSDFNISSTVFLPDFDGLNLNKYLLPTLPLSTSRGCAYARCSFCNHYKNSSGYYSNHIVKTVDNIEYLYKRYGTRFFHLVDDVLEEKSGTAIAKELLSRQINVSIITYARFEPAFLDRNILPLWWKSGIKVIEWGLESASQSLLNKMSKGISVRQVQKILDISADAGIVNKLMLFHNYPGESCEDLKQTIDFLKKNIKSRKIRHFMTIRAKLELRWNTPLEVSTRNGRHHPFRKRYCRSSQFESLLGYADQENYYDKLVLIDNITNEMQKYCADMDIYTTNDENMSMDLIILDLKQIGYKLYLNIL